jgi:hypothetical protein
MRTHMDELARLLMPAVQATVPGRSLQRRQRIDAAIDVSGNIRAEAIQLLGAIIPGGWIDNATYSITSTSDYTVTAPGVLALTQGTWFLKVRAWLRYGVGSGNDADCRLVIDGVPQASVTTRSGPSSSAGPVYLFERVASVEGDREIAIRVEIKSDSGSTVTVNQVMVDVDAYRTG